MSTHLLQASPPVEGGRPPGGGGGGVIGGIQGKNKWWGVPNRRSLVRAQPDMRLQPEKKGNLELVL